MKRSASPPGSPARRAAASRYDRWPKTNKPCARSASTPPQPEHCKESLMKYLCLVYLDEKRLPELPDEDCVEFDTSIRHSGHCIASEALESVQTATTVRVRDGRVAITDGPFAETKEQLAGFYMIDARDLDE